MPRRRRLIDAFHETEKRLRQILREFQRPSLERAWRLMMDEIAAHRQGGLLKRLLRERSPRARATRESVIGPRLHRMALSILRKEADTAHAAAVREVEHHGRGEHARTEAAIDTLARMMKAQWHSRLADARMFLKIEAQAREMSRLSRYHRWLTASSRRRRQVPRASTSQPPRSP